MRYDEFVGRRWGYEKKNMDYWFNLLNCMVGAINYSTKTKISQQYYNNGNSLSDNFSGSGGTVPGRKIET